MAQIHRAAVAYYVDLSGQEAKAEELYHRLMLEQSERTLDKHWDQVALHSLIQSIDELPPESQVYLWSKSDGEISLHEEITREASDRSWAGATESTATAELRAGRPEVALQLVRERRGPSDESLLPSVEVEALEELRELDEALEILRVARTAALKNRRSADAVALSLDVLRVLERLARFDEAVSEARNLTNSLAAGRGESALDYLVAMTSYLRLLRRSGQQDSAEYEAAADKAASVAESLQYRELTSRPGLLRELLAEIGDRSSRLLEFGVETVGVARGRSARLDEELDKVDESVEIDEPEPEAGPGSEDAADVDDRFETRGNIAQKVSKYAKESGIDEDFAGAIKESYQAETDELYS